MTKTTQPKMSRHQSLHMAQIRRLGAAIISKTVNADGTLSVTWRYRGQTITETVERSNEC